MRNNKLALTVVAVAVIAAAGCSRDKLREDFRESNQINVASQVVNPDAAAQAPQTNAVDGQKVEKAVQRYRADKADASRGKLLSELGN